MQNFTVLYEQIEDGWWMATCVEIPEAKTQGETLEEARENIKDAIQLVIESKRDLAGKEFPEDGTHIRESLELAL